MRIGIHQPNFLPWMGYFYKMAQCDTFVFLDNVEFTKQSFTKRVHIHKGYGSEEDQYITVPLERHSDHSLIMELNIAQEQQWQQKITRQLYEAYHKAPFYHQVEPLIEAFFSKPQIQHSFSAYTIDIISYASNLLGLNTTLHTASQLNLEKSDIDESINLKILKHLGGTVYISGQGAKKYQDETQFHKENIVLEYSDFKSRFNTLSLPDHFYNKSIISYLAWYELDMLRGYLSSTD